MIEYLLIACLVPLAGMVAWFGMRADRQAALQAPLLPGEVALATAVPDAADDLGHAQASADERWTTFLIGMSHELRTPLNAVIGFTEMLGDADLQPAQAQQVRLIADSGRAMLRLVNDILDIARVRAGQLRLVEDACDLASELKQVADLLRPIAAAQGVGLVLDMALDFPARQVLDRVRLRQVLLNLVGNALKFTEHGQVTLTATTGGAATAAGDTIVLHVHDTGRGIAPERLATLFTPFAPDQAGATRPFGGTGLGLPLCAEFVALMGGTITVDSRPGAGSTFTVTLPSRPAARPAAVPTAPPSAGSEAGGRANPEKAPSGLAGVRVLIAEDHEINQQLILAMADALGLDADLAADGQEAVAMAQQARDAGRPYRVVLMDVQMPVMDGLAAARALRADGFCAATLPVIALTANCFAQDIAAVREAGMQAHLAKPLLLADLARALEQALAASAPPAPPADCHDVTRLPEGASPAIHALDHRYRQRKREIVGTIGAALDRDAGAIDWEDIAGRLHKLAGVAANFGDAALGDVARQLEHGLRTTTDVRARQQMLAHSWPDLERCA